MDDYVSLSSIYLLYCFLYVCVWSEPRFVAAHLIPDSADKDDDKVYFFFTEKVSEAGEREGEAAIHTRIGRVCAVRMAFPHTHTLNEKQTCQNNWYVFSPPYTHSCRIFGIPKNLTHTTHSTTQCTYLYTHIHTHTQPHRAHMCTHMN